MRITFVNVGYGDAIFIESDNGYTVLLDGGGNLPQEFDGDQYRIRCIDYLRAKNIHHIDTLLISHIHEDHVCGLLPIMEEVSIGNIYVPYPTEPFQKGKFLIPADGAPRSVPLYTAALNAYLEILLTAKTKQIPLKALRPGDTLNFSDDCRVKVLAPKTDVVSDYLKLVEKVYTETDPDVVTSILTKLDATSNNTSFLLRFEVGNEVFLAAADNCPREWDQVDFSLLENVTVLKLPHHGQIDSISQQIAQVMPLRYVITTASSDRRYNSANENVYRQLSQMCPTGQSLQFLFTDERSYPPYFHQPEGFQAITLVIDSDGITPEFIKLYAKEKKEEPI